MHATSLLHPATLVLATFLVDTAIAAKKPANSVLLSNIQTLTLRKDAKTSHRRVSAIPQLRCIGGNAKGLYEVDVMRCKNQGADYDEHNVQWTCTASLPPEFKLGSTDVMCEGYDSPDDPYILKGSCGVEYRLMLTDMGEEKYGYGSDDLWSGFTRRGGKGSIDWSALIFWAIFLGVLGWILYSLVLSALGRRPGGRPLGGGGGNNQPWGGGGGGGGGGGHGPDDPPPPYDYQPPRKPYTPTSQTQHASSSRQQQQQQPQGWRPGFWTGALGGAAAGYMAGNRGRNSGSNTANQGRGGGSWFGGGTGVGGRDVGEGSSRWAGGGGGGGGGGSRRGDGPSSSSSSFSSSRHESTGFGSTSRR